MIMMLLESRPVELAIYAACDKSTRRANHPKLSQAPFDHNILIFGNNEVGLYPSHPVPLGGAIRDRHVRGMGCGGPRAARETGGQLADGQVVWT